ncbi:hypothetical protein BZG05_01530 [Salinivibrio kushneri]|uniref:hypothetical protein n=1 Tax=Salinivibrio kushneri TaxID=1908198 RepID=UPI0009891AB9|nr:hypothetical protein [Salinivibrio kushneri]OOE36190.1 hypothetical protein BZG05_01530 [Salinivibrio kushneri]
MSEEVSVTNEEFDLQIRFVSKNVSKSFIKQKHIVQGEPFIWGVEITNIGNKPTPEGRITGAEIHDLAEKFFQYMEEEEKSVKSLNPQETVYIELDRASVYLEGIQWAEIIIEPKVENCQFKTYQYEAHHNRTIAFSNSEDDLNKWMDSIYIQKRSELLQARTNQYILVLTLITVWESVIGLSETLKAISTGLEFLLSNAAKFFGYLGSLL